MSPSSTEHTGAMIALVPSDADLDRLVLPGGEPRDELHLTLWYLGEVADFTPAQLTHCVDATRAVVDAWNVTAAEPKLTANAFGVAYWNPTSETPAWVLNVGDTAGDGRLAQLRELIAQTWEDINWEPPPQYTPWQPHICVAYSTDDLGAELSARLGPLVLDRVRVAHGGEVTDFFLASPVTVAAAFGGDTVPWHKVQDHSECPPGKPWAVVKDATGEVAGCHASENEANAQLAALYASEGSAHSTVTPSPASTSVDVAELPKVSDEVTAFTSESSVTAASSADCPPGHHVMPDGSCMSPDEYAAAQRWSGVLCVEGTATGDGREFGVNALTWADRALLRWQKEGSHGGDHDVTVSVGRIDNVWRDGNVVYGQGVLNLLEPDGWTIYNRLKNGFAGGISIDADDITDADVEFVWGDEDALDGEDDIVKFLFGRPEKMIYHAGRVRAATLVDIPAFVEAHIALVGEGVDVVAASAALIERPVIEAHVTETTDAPWNEKLVRDAWRVARGDKPLPRESFTWNTGDAQVYLHHHVNSSGDDVGPANLTACSAALARLNANDDAVPLVDRVAVYEHLAQHLRDAGQVPPPPLFTLAEVVTAALPEPDWRPPRSWFEDPHLSVHTGITVTDQGRVYGHIAPWGECHIGFTEECITTPYEDSHPYFLTGELICADGSHVSVGQITLGTGHAPIHYQASRAAEHYDNTGCAVVDVTIGNDAYGIWCAGAVRPHVAAARVHELRASGRVSGDWRRIGGHLRLVGVLAVNVPGFPIPKVRARVASGVPQALVAAGTHLVIGRTTEPQTDADLDQHAMRRVMDMLARRVRPAAAAIEGEV